MRLIINQVLACLEKRPEGSPPIVLILDELPRLLSEGKITRLLDAARTLRSRNVTLVLVTQSLEALEVAYSRPEMLDLVSNCSFKAILSSSSPETSKMIVGWVGKYRAKKYGKNSGKNISTNVSFEDRNIIEPNELISLPQTGEAILVTDFGYFRIKKAPYYKDALLSQRAGKIAAHNVAIKNVTVDFR